jgi:hypothetical protein
MDDLTAGDFAADVAQGNFAHPGGVSHDIPGKENVIWVLRLLERRRPRFQVY